MRDRAGTTTTFRGTTGLHLPKSRRIYSLRYQRRRGLLAGIGRCMERPMYVGLRRGEVTQRVGNLPAGKVSMKMRGCYSWFGLRRSGLGMFVRTASQELVDPSREHEPVVAVADTSAGIDNVQSESRVRGGSISLFDVVRGERFPVDGTCCRGGAGFTASSIIGIPAVSRFIITL
jgi:hypothetical protein